MGGNNKILKITIMKTTNNKKSAFISSLVFRFYLIGGDLLRIAKGISLCLSGILILISSFYFFIITLNDFFGIFAILPIISISFLYGYFVINLASLNSKFDDIQYKLNR